MKAISSVADLIQRKGRAVISTSADATLSECSKVMWTNGVSSVLIRSEEGGVAGLVSSRDILRVAAEGGARLDSVRAGEVMTKQLRTVQEAAGIEEAEQTMIQHDIRHLPVLRGRELVGLLSRIDVLRHYLDKQNALSDELERYISGGHSG